jgi:hypothetical protein
MTGATATLDDLPERMLRVLTLRRAGCTYRAIGREMGYSPARAQRVAFAAVARLGWPLGVLYPEARRTCAKCRRRVASAEARSGRCVDCRLRGCRECGRTFDPRHGRLYCDDCRWVVRPCANCGDPVAVRRSDRTRQRNRAWYCDRRCHGAAFGRRHGVPALRRWQAARLLALAGAG